MPVIVFKCIVDVLAKDKDPSTTIASSSGLSDKDTEKIVADAEQFAEADNAHRALIEEGNKADSVCADTEKGLFLHNNKCCKPDSALCMQRSRSGCVPLFGGSRYVVSRPETSNGNV